jgi:hypothetical protein
LIDGALGEHHEPESDLIARGLGVLTYVGLMTFAPMGRTQEREIYARLNTASPSCDCELHFKLTRLIAASLTCVVLEGD